MKSLDAVAAVFDKLAELEEARAAEPVVVAKVAEPTKVAAPVEDPTLTLVRTAVGRDVTPETAAKIAADADLLDVVAKIAAEKSKPTPLGGPSEEKVAYPTSDKKERLADAYSNWGHAVSRHG